MGREEEEEERALETKFSVCKKKVKMNEPYIQKVEGYIPPYLQIFTCGHNMLIVQMVRYGQFFPCCSFPH